MNKTCKEYQNQQKKLYDYDRTKHIIRNIVNNLKEGNSVIINEGKKMT